MPFDTGDLVKRADYIFIGKVIKVTSRALESEFQVNISWKGDLTKRVVVSTEDTTCGIKFEKNTVYIVFGVSGKKGVVNTNRCMGTGEENGWVKQHLNTLSREDGLELRQKYIN